MLTTNEQRNLHASSRLRNFHQRPRPLSSGQDNKLYDQLMAEVKKRKRYVKTAAEVRRLADAELGDKTITEVLYEMRNEAI